MCILMWRKKKAELIPTISLEHWEWEVVGVYKSWEQEIYYIKVWTFRRTLELRIWWGKEECEKVWMDYNLTWGFYYFDEENNCNLIWLRDYNLNTLIHELIHCVENMCEQVGLEMKWEPIAYMYEELFTQIWNKCWKKFKLDKDTADFYKK